MPATYELPSLLDGPSMTRLRDGVWYSTADSERRQSYRTNRPLTDPKFAEEVLYQDGGGRYFLIGRGGAESDWAARLLGSPDFWAPGKGLFPLTLGEMETWRKERFGS